VAWFRNRYRCEDCEREWADEWSSTCDDDCPHCGARHMSPYKSDDLTEVVEERDGKFIALRSPESAEDAPDYQEVAVICEQPKSGSPR
jgi:DNA-directed RNA polymerase subunit RPC12/RpoP